MRYSENHKKLARVRLIRATGAYAKKQGFAATGVDDLMASAGLTSGAFYCHFQSKAELLEEIVKNELSRSIDLFENATADQLFETIDGYLSTAHIDTPESGCSVPALAAEISRSKEATKQIFQEGMIELKNRINVVVNDESKSWTTIAQLVGAVTIARGMPSGTARESIIRGVSIQLKHFLGAP